MAPDYCIGRDRATAVNSVHDMNEVCVDSQHAMTNESADVIDTVTHPRLDFNPPHMHLAPPYGLMPVEFRGDLRQ